MSRFAIAAALVLSTAAVANEELATVGQTAPAFRLPQYVGKEVVGLDRWVGAEPTEPGVKTVVMSFMASFCEPCKKEMPYLQLLHEKYKDKGLRVMMISIDTEPEGQKKVLELLTENKVTFPVLKDRFNLVARRWLGSKVPLPSLFIVGADGTITEAHRGYNDDMSQTLLAEVQTKLGVPKEEVRLAVPTPPAPEPVAEPKVDPKKAKKGSKEPKQTATVTPP